MGVILDTSVLIAFERPAVDAETLIQGREREVVGICVVTAAELLHGVHRADSSTWRRKRAAYVEKVLDQFTLYPFDLAAARIYAELWATLQKQGIQIGAHDAMIAATAVSLGFSIATFNVRDYEKIEGLSTPEWIFMSSIDPQRFCVHCLAPRNLSLRTRATYDS